jgi:chromosomal replication initiator protein
VLGSENRLARVALGALVRGGLQYNPTMLVGPPGCGKTHLAWAIAGEIASRNRQRQVAVSTDRVWVHDLHRAVERNKLAEFRARHTAASLWVMDDLDALAGRTTAQWEWRQTFDLCSEQGVPMVFTSRQQPNELWDLPPSLRGRLSGGLIVRLAPPQPATRCQLLLELARQQGVTLPEDAAEFLSTAWNCSPSELADRFRKFVRALQVAGQRPNLTEARAAVQSESQRRDLPLRTIASRAAKQFGLKVADLRSATRQRSVATARQVAMCAARRLTGRSYHEIGRFFGERDHTTAMHACRQVEERLASDGPTQLALAEILESLIREV